MSITSWDSKLSSSPGSYRPFDDFSCHENLFYRPPPRVSSRDALIARGSDESATARETSLRDLLCEMRGYIDNHNKPPRIFKPLPPPPLSDLELEPARQSSSFLRKGQAPECPYIVPDNDDVDPIFLPSTATTSPRAARPLHSARMPSVITLSQSSSSSFADSPPISPLRARSSSTTLCASIPDVDSKHSKTQRQKQPALKACASLPSFALALKTTVHDTSAPTTPTTPTTLSSTLSAHTGERCPGTKADAEMGILPTPTLTRVTTTVTDGMRSPYNPAFLTPALSTANVSRWSLTTSSQSSDPSSPAAGRMNSATKFARGRDNAESPARGEAGTGKQKVLTRTSSQLSLRLGLAKAKLLGSILRIPTRSASRKRLVVRGVRQNDAKALSCLRSWCENFGAVRKLSSKPGGDVHVHFRDRSITDDVVQEYPHVWIASIGSLSLSCAYSR